MKLSKFNLDIVLWSFSYILLDEFFKLILSKSSNNSKISLTSTLFNKINLNSNFSIKINSYFKKPILEKSLTLLKSPHVNKKSMEHFSMKKYRYLLRLSIYINANNNLNSFIYFIKSLAMYNGVYIKIIKK